MLEKIFLVVLATVGAVLMVIAASESHLTLLGHFTIGALIVGCFIWLFASGRFGD
jgi:Flp pilus assembly protein protease CpaA